MSIRIRKTSARLELSSSLSSRREKKECKDFKWVDQNQKAVGIAIFRIQVSLNLVHFLLNCLSLGSQFLHLNTSWLPPPLGPPRSLHGTAERIKRDKRSGIILSAKSTQLLQGHLLFKPHPSWRLAWLYNKSIHPANSLKTSVWVNYNTLSFWQFTSRLLINNHNLCYTSCFEQWVTKFQW